jgi:sulfatase modifying factor 1
MAEPSAAALALSRTENLLFFLLRRDHLRHSKSMVRKALAGVLATLLAQLTFGAAFEQIAQASSRFGWNRVEPEARVVPTSATAEALSRAAPISVAPAITATPGDVPASPAPAIIPVAPDASGSCPRDMVLVEGEYCSDVLQVCNRWLDDETLPFARCAEYQSPAHCIGSRVKQRFCIDRYEYTAPGDSLPLNFQSFEKASAVCGGLGKRVCTESEWNFACEGEEMRPYPYGFSRQAVCNQDRSDLYEPNPHYQVLADRREPATARPECVSPFGVFNMAGNMDEPVLREGSAHIEPYRNALKGGWWMAARNRCRPATTAHDDYYRDIQVGVRCCSAAN